MTARKLLDGLLLLYWREGVTQKEAAKLLGIRKDEFAELAALRRCCLIIEDAAWRYFLAQFNHTFPECDRRATKRDTGPRWDRKGRMYTDDQLLTPPDPGTRSEPSSLKWAIGTPPPGNPRVPAREMAGKSHRLGA